MIATGLKPEKMEEAVGGLKALAHPSRLQVLCALLGQDLTVGQLVELTGQSQSGVSQHLTRMTAAGIISGKRVRNQVFYSVKETGYKNVVEALCGIYGSKNENSPEGEEEKGLII